MTNQPYAYAGSDPINQIDPTGQCPMCAVLFVGFVSGAGTDLALQMANNLANGCSAFQDISWGEVLASGVGGAAFDGLGYVAFKSLAYGFRVSSFADRAVTRMGVDDWPVISGIVRDAARGKGNFGLGMGTYSQALRRAGPGSAKVRIGRVEVRR